jgi:peptidoglycan hydrolase FlgJ
MTSPLADASLTANSPSVYTDISGLSALKRDAKAQSPETVRKVAQQFESIFAKMVLSSMRQANFGDSLFGSDQQQFYQGMFDDQLAVELTKGKGLGLADMLVQQLTRAGLVKGDSATAGEAAKVGDAAKISAPATSASGISQPGTARAAEAAPSLVVSSTLLGTTTQSALEATTNFIDRMLAGNAEANAPKVWRSGSPEEFVQQLWPCAEEAGKALGVDPKHLLAQAALETGWGKSLPCDVDGTPSFNFFGIKAGNSWQGDSVSVKTLEFEGGVPVPQRAKFRAYDSPVDSFRDYVEVLRNNPRFAGALNTGSDARAFAHALQKGGYATDPRYAMKIETIVQNLPISETALKSSTDAPMTSTTDVF